MIEFETGNEQTGTLQWAVEVPEATRWEILRRNLVMLRAGAGQGLELVADVTGLLELVEQQGTIGARRDGEQQALHSLPYLHLHDAAAAVAWWLHTGLDPAELQAARQAAAGEAAGPFAPAGNA